MQKHIVHKQKVTLHLSHPDDAFSLQGRVSNLLQQELKKSMEVLFDEMFDEGKIVRINKLDIQLDNIEKDNLEKELPDAFAKALKTELQKIKDGRHEAENIVAVTREESLAESLIHFLRFGYLPWYSVASKMNEWEDQLVNELSLKDWQRIFVMLQQERTQEKMIERLARQFSDDFLATFFEKITGRETKEMKPLVEDLIEVTIQTTVSNKKDAGLIVWIKTFKALMKDVSGKNVEEFVLWKLITSETEVTKLDGLVVDKLKTDLVKQALEKVQERNESSFLSQEQNEKTEAEKSAGNKKEKVQTYRAVYVKHAGLVILHPFLQAYFKELDLLNEKNFVDEAKQKRAILLLYHLSTNKKEVPEFDAVLQKILCGLELDETIPSAIELTEKEKVESEQLLRTVMSYWPPLKSSSVPALQQTFLQREGKLSKTDSGWLLQVEQKTLDILLNKLPWGFSTIKLPWMPDILNVEWY